MLPRDRAIADLSTRNTYIKQKLAINQIAERREVRCVDSSLGFVMVNLVSYLNITYHNKLYLGNWYRSDVYYDLLFTHEIQNQ